MVSPGGHPKPQEMRWKWVSKSWGGAFFFFFQDMFLMGVSVDKDASRPRAKVRSAWADSGGGGRMVVAYASRQLKSSVTLGGGACWVNRELNPRGFIANHFFLSGQNIDTDYLVPADATALSRWTFRAEFVRFFLSLRLSILTSLFHYYSSFVSSGGAAKAQKKKKKWRNTAMPTGRQEVADSIDMRRCFDQSPFLFSPSLPCCSPPDKLTDCLLGHGTDVFTMWSDKGMSERIRFVTNKPRFGSLWTAVPTRLLIYQFRIPLVAQSSHFVCSCLRPGFQTKESVRLMYNTAFYCCQMSPSEGFYILLDCLSITPKRAASELLSLELNVTWNQSSLTSGVYFDKRIYTWLRILNKVYFC